MTKDDPPACTSLYVFNGFGLFHFEGGMYQHILKEGVSGEGFSLTNGIRGCSKVLKCIFVNFGISMGGLSSHT